MAKQQLPQVITPRDVDGIAVLAVIETERLTKNKGERDTEFVKRIVAAYLNACGLFDIKPLR